MFLPLNIINSQLFYFINIFSNKSTEQPSLGDNFILMAKGEMKNDQKSHQIEPTRATNFMHLAKEYFLTHLFHRLK